MALAACLGLLPFPSGGYYGLTARHSGKCLDIRYGSTEAGARAIQYTCKGSANQQWQRVGAPY